MPTTPDSSEKIVLAAGALQHLLPTPERPPFSSGFRKSDRMLKPGLFGDDTLLSDIAIATSSILYGLVHFLAWSEQFPTPLERFLWRVSSIVVTCSGLVEVITAEFITRVTSRYRIVDPIYQLLWLLICGIIIPLAHVLASGFLIVESVRQLLFLDDAAYQLPAWSNYWPHFS